MITDELNQAIELIKKGKRAPARDLILEAVKSDPTNLDAWLWALEVAANDKERRVILGKILKIDPGHKAAVGFLKKLDHQSSHPDQPSHDPQNPVINDQGKTPSKTSSRLSALLGLFFDWAASLPSGCLFIAIFIGIVASVFIYTRVNTSFFGLAGTDFDSLVISNSYEKISSDEYHWEVQFEGIGETKYIGTVRHAAPIRIQEFAILTHDILVTSGDFADPSIVNTNVIDHKFFWKSPNLSSPNGSINLIHAIPATKSIYQQMLEISKWDKVQITGREILTVKAYQSDNNFLGSWQDTGCNTLLVESVTILEDTQ